MIRAIFLLVILASSFGRLEAMAVLKRIVLTPQALRTAGVELEIARQERPFRVIHITSKIGPDQPHYRFERTRLILASGDVTASNVERITTEGPHILRSDYKTDRQAEYDFVGTQCKTALLVFEYQKTDESVTTMIWYCLPISTLIDDEK